MHTSASSPLSAEPLLIALSACAHLSFGAANKTRPLLIPVHTFASSSLCTVPFALLACASLYFGAAKFSRP